MSPRAENKMGKWGATSYMIGNTIGSGIFISPQSILNNASSVGVSLIIWLVSALVTMMIAICYVELGTSIRKSGADFAYLCYVKWHSLAFAFMSCGCILIYPATLVIQAETFAEYVLRSLRVEFCSGVDGFANNYAKKFISFSTVWLLLYLNFFSVRTVVARFQIVASMAKLFATFIIIGTGIYILCFTETGARNLADPFANSNLNAGSLTSAFFAGLFSYDGWDVLNYGVEELADPARSMLFATLVGMSTVTVIFLAMNVAYFVVLTVPQVNETAAIATTFGQVAYGGAPPMQHFISLLVSIVLIGSINSTLFSASRFLFAASRSRQFPSWISCINPKHDSPRAALVFHVLLAFAFSFAGDMQQLLNYVGFSQWIQRLITVILLMYIRFAKITVHPEAVRLPLAIPTVFLLAVGCLVAVTLATSIDSCWRTLAVLAASLALYYSCVSPKFSLTNKFPSVRVFLESANEQTSRISQFIFNGVIDLEEEEESEISEEEPKIRLEECENHKNTTFRRSNKVASERF